MERISLARGQIVGEYLLQRKIGQGATGEVWLAHHHLWQDRIAAIKIPTNPHFLESIKREGAIHNDLSALDSPFLVRVLGLNLLSNPPYLAMEYVSGSDLRRKLKENGKIPLFHTLRIMEDIIQGLHQAHRIGIIHRDIKPENILIDQEGRAKLSDFSLALQTPDLESLRASLESSPESAPSLAGTLVYMSPEQRQGLEVDQRSDIYSMGLLFFEMLTGELPQPGDRISDFLPDLPTSVDTFFLKCFTRRERRYQSSQELLQTIKSLQTPQQSSKKQPEELLQNKTQSPKTPRQSKVASLSTRDLRPQTKKIPDKTKEHKKTRQLSTRSLESLKKPAITKSLEKKSTPLKPAKRNQPSNPLPAGSQDIERLLMSSNSKPENPSPETGAKEFQDPRPSRQYEGILPSLEALYRQHTTAQGMALYASAQYNPAAQFFQNMLKKNPQDLASKKGLAMSLFRLGKSKEALLLYQEIAATDPKAAEVWNNVGVLSMENGRYKEAEKALLQAIKLKPLYAAAYANLGALYQRMGRQQDSRKASEKALEIDPDNIAAGYNVGFSL